MMMLMAGVSGADDVNGSVSLIVEGFLFCLFLFFCF